VYAILFTIILSHHSIAIIQYSVAEVAFIEFLLFSLQLMPLFGVMVRVMVLVFLPPSLRVLIIGLVMVILSPIVLLLLLLCYCCRY
jgi:hypothetical protein